jgi:hypothetical protein
MGFDSSQGRRDATAWLIGQWWQPQLDDRERFQYVEVAPDTWMAVTDSRGRPVPVADVAEPRPEFTVRAIGWLDGGFAKRGTTSDEVVERVADIARRHGVRNIFADEYQGFALTSAFARHRLAFIPQTWSSPSKGDALMRLATWARDGALAIEPGDGGARLVKELIGLRETIRPSGAISLGARRGGFDDVACALLNLAMADGIGTLRGSPIQRSFRLVVGTQVG